jgi:hypothetical protein
MAKTDKHEYLTRKDYYESRSVGKRAHSDKTCEHCGKTIKKGTPHLMHHFYPEFNSYATHDREHGSEHGDRIPDDEKSCDELFMESLND